MNDGKRYVFYDVKSGDRILTESRNKLSFMPTVERVIEIYPMLHERAKESYDVLILDYDQYAQDFAESNGYRVDVETKTLEFSYPDPDEPEAPQVFQKPLSEQITELKAENLATMGALAEVYEMILGGM